MHEETSESVVYGVKAPYSCRAEHVWWPDALSCACLLPIDCFGISAAYETEEMIVTE